MLNNSDLLYESQEVYAEAKEFHQRAQAIFEKALGPDHPYVAESLFGLASTCEKQHRFAEALPPL